MKRLLMICVLVALGASTSFAQDHQTFKGVPIDGKTNTFINRLKLKGFQTVGNTDTLIGTFAGYNNCEVTLLSSTQTNNVYGVKVKIPMCQDQNLMIYTEFKKLQAVLTEKYGQPVKEEVHSYENDFIKALYKLITSAEYSDSYPFSSTFDTGCGSVELNVAWIASDCGGGFIIMTYIDNANNISRLKSIYDDL
jgi:hypothetical protein